MKISVNISTLKAKLSEYLGEVKRGNEIIVMDRSTPIAKLEAIRPRREALILTEPTRSPQDLLKIKRVKLRKKIDVVALLREDRDRW